MEYKPFEYYSRSVLRIKVSETANYTCYAINQMIGGRQSSDTKSFMVYVKTDDENTSKGDTSDMQQTPSKGYYAPYNGQVCKKYLQGRGLVWFNISKDNSGGWVNEQITQSLWNELIVKLQEPCRSAAEVCEIVHYAYSCRILYITEANVNAYYNQLPGFALQIRVSGLCFKRGSSCRSSIVPTRLHCTEKSFLFHGLGNDRG